MVEIAGKTFETIKDLREFVFDILNNAPIDELLSEDDSNMLIELFLCHPEADDKTGGKSIQHIKVGKHAEAGARAFTVVLDDESENTFSIKKCLSAWTKKNQPVEQKKPKVQKKSNVQKNVSTQSTGINTQLKQIISLYNELGREIAKMQKLLTEKKDQN
ncbi:hypothetical protein C6497_05805 [Candidatus Poribacteria bacterium]|nr:MAG: hypothetical protein C6497_05805 [Candidatus Poribacteria bacterium]